MSSSPNYVHLAHLKIPLEAILSATNNFGLLNYIEEADFGYVYRGRLLWSGELINIHARRIFKEEDEDEDEEDEDEEFWMEISMLSTLKHKNLISLVGFCDENDEKVIITTRETRGLLYEYLDKPMLLTWVRRLEICVGLAQALSYIHHDELRSFSVIHRNIASTTVELDDDWEPKLSYFAGAMKIEASQRHHSFQTDTLEYMDGYGDPTYIKTNTVNHKSDIYSFGIVLCELLCGTKSIISDDINEYLAPLTVTDYREKNLIEIIDWDLWKQMDPQSCAIFSEIAYDCLNEERSQRPHIDEIVPRLQKALELTRENKPIMSSLDDFSHLKISLEDILSGTDNFFEGNFIESTRMTWKHKKVIAKKYKGQILWSGELIKIVAQRLNKESDDEDEEEFWMQFFMLSGLEHKNVVSVVGFCDENDEKIIIYRHESRGMLDQYLCDPVLLTWVQRLKICVGLAKALSYIHYDEARDFSVIHRRIDSSTFLLDDDWEPKLNEFQLSMRIKASQRHCSFHTSNSFHAMSNECMNGYGDPTYMETHTVNHKSDMYSFGVVLFELLCCRDSVMSYKDDKHLAPLAITHYREEKLSNIIHPELWKQMDLHSFNMFAEIAYECLDEERSRRPNIDDIVPRLEKALELARENRRIHSSPNHLAHLRIPLEDIESATNYFDEENSLGTSGVYKVYKGVLLWSGELVIITAWKLSNKEWDEIEQQFWMEISMISSLQHKNLVSIFGFCNEVGAETIIYKRLPMGRLGNYLSNPMLTWMKRLKISAGIAHALSYIHYDDSRDFSVIHRNISSETILLNDDWEPKLSEFQHSMKIKASERHNSILTDLVWSNKGYADPTYVETSNVDHKSDIYSFGIVLFELFCGRKSASDNHDNKYLAPVATFHYREKILDGIVDPDLWRQMDPQSLNIFAETAYECLYEDQSQRPNMDQIVARLEKALELQLECENAEYSSVVEEVGGTSSSHEERSAIHFTSNSSKKTTSSLKYLSHSQLSFEDIESATNNFALENTIREKASAWVYQGGMLHSGEFIDIVARGIYSNYRKDESKKFRMEKSMLSSLNHTNLVSAIGFCDDNMIIVYKKEVNGSLKKYLSDETLTWMQRLKICLGVANALSYIHYDVGRDFSVIHCNIKSSTILLDDKWESKLSGFKLSLRNTVARRHRLHLTRDIVENAYMDPKYITTGGVTHKSDVYSFGVVLFEVLCGRSAVLPDEELEDGLLSQLAKSHLDDMIHPHLREQMDPEAFKIFSDTAYYCIQEERAMRPHIDYVVNRLEKALHLQRKHDNPVDNTSSNRLKEKNFEDLKVGLDLINEATKNFDDAYCIGSGGFGNGTMILVYEHASKGSLESYLGSSDKMTTLTWVQRLNIRDSVMSYKDDKHLAPLAITHYREKKLSNIIHPELWKQMDLHSFNMFAEIAYECLDEERSRRPNIDDIVPRLEKALELARENRRIHSSPNHLAHLRIPLEDIESATNYFDEENSLGTSGVYKVYKGVLLWSGELVIITAWKLSNKEWDEIEQQFWMEISMISSLQHKNLVSIFGFCNEVGAETIIYKRLPMGRLGNYLSNPMLTWMKRLKISAGIAHALSYIHYDDSRDFSVIHRNISSETILLNDDWEPKLSEFQHSMKIKASERHNSILTDLVWSNKGYADPTYVETSNVDHKSDIYSFGIVLFELFCGRKSASDNHDNKYLAPVATFHYREKILDGIVDPDLWRQMDPQSLNIFAETAYECLYEDQSQRPNMDQIVARLEKALELQLECENAEYSSVVEEVGGTSSSHEERSAIHFTSNSSKKTTSSLKYLSHSQLSFEDIESATNNFALENTIREKASAWVYQGGMLHSGEFIDIVARGIYSNYRKDESKKFRMEKSMLSSLNHTNLVSAIGFCDDNMIIVYKKEVNGSLKKYLSDETLTWMQRLKICLGVANALSYIHYDVGRDFSVIHCNIKSSTILLDDKWESKLSGFKLSLRNTVARRHRLHLTRDIVENAYMDPKYITTGGVTHKSDVYSFGVVLFEVLCGRSAVLPDEELEDGLLSQLAKSHLDDMIHPHLREQMDPEAFKIFSDTAYYCIQEERAMRPHIDYVVNRLEKALHLQRKHDNPVDNTSSNRLKEKNFEDLKMGLDLINEATKNFDDAYCIGSGGFGKVYKADLEHFDSSNSSLVEGVSKCDLPRKRSTVAIKRINNQEGEEGFIAEIETLTSCKHENIISLLGFCYEGNGTMILVYEHASKGSLESYLGSSDKMTTLTWVQRLNICLDVAHGLNYIHNNTDHGKQKMIHRDIKSDNILLGDNWEAKIADFGLSKFHPEDQSASTFFTSMIAGTYVYLDPEYQKYGKLSKKSDIYSFGVVLLEILTGKLAYDSVYTNGNEKGIAPIARDHFEKGTIREIIDHKIKEEADENVFSLSKGPNKESLDIFLKIAFGCVAETQAPRPTIEVVIKELKKAIKCQENHKDNFKLSLEDVNLATQDFSQHNIIAHGDFGILYRGVVTHAHGQNIIAAKRLDDAEFMTELEILMEYKHENVIVPVGYCDEENEKVIVYEYASRGSLDKYLSDDSLTWVMRLKICIDIATGLEFLHGTVSSPEMVIHRDISSSNILLFDDWKAKITNFGLSLVCPTNQNVDYAIDNVIGTIGYRDPLHSETGFLTKESDIFSLGAVLVDILCGKLSSETLDDEYLYLPFLAKHHYYVGKLDKLVFEGIKEQIVPQSYITFTRIAFQCLHHRRERRPRADEVVLQLKKSLEFQEDYENWEPKLPKDYNEIIRMSKSPEIFSTIKKEDLYNIFSKGILLQQDKVLLSFDGDRERNEMVSATMFSYIDSCPHEWKSLPESRFETVVKILDISNLMIEIKTRAQFLSPNVVYGVYLVFKFCDSRSFSSKPMYVNLKYRKGHESLHAYFATWRDEQWMMIELDRFSSQNEDVVFEYLLESFSLHHCGDTALYVEGIEFRAINTVKHEEIGKLKEVQQVLKSDFNVDQVQQLPTNFEEIFKVCRNYDELFWLGEVDGKKLLVLSAKAALYKFSNADTFTAIPPGQSRFQEVIELLPQQVFHINCTIKSQMLSPNSEYVCYLLFKLSENCQGMHCPVKVRDVLHPENKETEFLYFITPEPSNLNDITRFPKQREDGWMEIQLWKFNAAHEFKDDTLSMNMKFTSLEGTMSGLIVCDLEFRPM